MIIFICFFRFPQGDGRTDFLNSSGEVGAPISLLIKILAWPHSIELRTWGVKSEGGTAFHALTDRLMHQPIGSCINRSVNALSDRLMH